jgi:DNA primase
MDFGDALRFLAARAGIEIPTRVQPDTKKDEKDKLFEINGAAVLYFHNLLLNSPAAEPARKYLEKRGLDEKTISDFQLGFSLDSWDSLKEYLLGKGYSEAEILETEEGHTYDRFRNRLMFTISDSRGRTTGFGGRILIDSDSQPKYVNSPQSPVFDKSGTLYAINLAAQEIRRRSQAIMMEGYMDVIAAHQFGITNTVASMGTAITERQVNDLKKLTRNIVLAMDADSAGEEAMLRCVGYESSADIELKVVVLPEGTDPDNVIRESTAKWQELLDKAVPVVDYTFDMVRAGLDLEKAADKRLLVERLGPVIKAIRNPVRRAHYLQRLARLAGVDERSLQASLRTTRTASPYIRPGTGRGIRPAANDRPVQPLLSRPVEEQFLAFLLKHPEYRERSRTVSPEYFENSENREIFTAWRESADIDVLREILDDTLFDHLEALIGKNILATMTDERYNNYVLRLKEDHLRSLARKGETGKTAGELPGEKDLELTDNLREIFHSKARRDGGKGGRK